MKKIWYLIAVIFAVMLTACENGPKHHYDDDDDDDDKPSVKPSEDSPLTPAGDKTMLWPALDTLTLQYGYINEEGKFVIEPQFDQAYGFSCGLAFVANNGVVSFINTKGEKVATGINGALSPYFTYNRLKFMSNVYYGMFDTNFQQVIEPVYSELGEPTADGLIRFNKYIEGTSTRCGYMDMDGNEVLPAAYEGGGDFEDGMAIVSIKDTLTGEYSYAVIDKTGKFVLGPDKDIYQPVGEGLFLRVDMTLFRYDLVTIKGKVLVEDFKKVASYFKGGLMLTMKSDGLWYFINKEGYEVFGPYYEAHEFFDGIAWVRPSESDCWKALKREDGKVLYELIENAEPVSDFHNGLSLVKEVKDTYEFYAYINKTQDSDKNVVYYWFKETAKEK